MAITLKDIAAIAGISVNSVSRALKDKSDISVETRQRVKTIAASLGYRPNLNARSLVLKKSSLIGLAVTEPDNPVRMEFCERLRFLAEKDGYHLLIAGFQPLGETPDVLAVENLLGRGIDGLIAGYFSGIIAEQPIGELLRQCRASQFPTVLFGAVETELCDHIYIDFEKSVYELTVHMLRQGIVPEAFFSVFQERRVAGYRRALREFHVESAERLVYLPAPGYVPAAEAITRRLKEGAQAPRGIIAGNDIAAIGIITALRRRGLKVPEDVAVAGIDNTEHGAFYNPSLTSIGFERNGFADKIWEMLHDRLTNGMDGMSRRVVLNQQLVVRESCP
ncbi:MAG: LacI family DNA-binding transcriptional regulator [Victivallales bacterium]